MSVNGAALNTTEYICGVMCKALTGQFPINTNVLCMVKSLNTTWKIELPKCPLGLGVGVGFKQLLVWLTFTALTPATTCSVHAVSHKAFCNTFTTK